ncbi:MAG: TIGR02147 family protein [Pseudobdellovibrio sp.]
MLIERLNTLLNERKKKNAQYSLRAFAKSLDMDSSTLSALLSGKRSLTPKMSKKIIDQLFMTDPFEAQNLLLQSIGFTNSLDFTYTEFEMLHAEIISSWEHFAILALLEIPQKLHSTRNISIRLNIPFDTTEQALARLEKINLVEKTDHNWILKKMNMATPSNVPNASIRKAHTQYIEKSLEALKTQPIEVRDITGVTMAIDSEKLPQARKLIEDFRRRLSAYLEQGTKNSVYRLNIQLFPLQIEDQA